MTVKAAIGHNSQIQKRNDFEIVDDQREDGEPEAKNESSGVGSESK